MTSTPGAARRVRLTRREASRSQVPLPTHVHGLPELPAAYHTTIEAGLRALGIDDLPADRRAAIDDHIRLLVAWTEAINLTAIRGPADLAREHVLDSLTAVPVLRSVPHHRMLDLGSGGGFPGLPLALVLEPERTLLVESVGKKARFLAAAVEAVAERLGPGAAGGLAIAATRAERLASDPHHRGRWHVVVARAIADLSELAELSLPLLVEGGRLIAWKREPLREELNAASEALDHLGGSVIAVEPVPIAGLADHRLVVVEKTRATPRGYPRDPAVRKRHPSRSVPPRSVETRGGNRGGSTGRT